MKKKGFLTNLFLEIFHFLVTLYLLTYSDCKCRAADNWTNIFWLENCIRGHSKQRNRKTWDTTSSSAQISLYLLALKYADTTLDWNWGTSASQIKVQQKIYTKCLLILNYTQTKNKICLCEFIKTVQSPPKIAVKILSCIQGNQTRYSTKQDTVPTNT